VEAFVIAGRERAHARQGVDRNADLGDVLVEQRQDIEMAGGHGALQRWVGGSLAAPRRVASDARRPITPRGRSTRRRRTRGSEQVNAAAGLFHRAFVRLSVESGTLPEGVSP